MVACHITNNNLASNCQSIGRHQAMRGVEEEREEIGWGRKNNKFWKKKIQGQCGKSLCESCCL